MTKVVISPRAISDIEEIWFYIALDSARAADQLSNAIFDRIEQLADFPEMGAPRPYIRPAMRALPHGRYMILYEFDARADLVDVMTVLDGARDLSGLI